MSDLDEFDLPADEVAYIEGKRAFSAGRQRSDNPYNWRDNRELKRQWLLGYNWEVEHDV